MFFSISSSWGKRDWDSLSRGKHLSLTWMLENMLIKLIQWWLICVILIRFKKKDQYWYNRTRNIAFFISHVFLPFQKLVPTQPHNATMLVCDITGDKWMTHCIMTHTPCSAALWSRPSQLSSVRPPPVECLWSTAEQYGLLPYRRLPSLALCAWSPTVTDTQYSDFHYGE